jgi:hypothetical protein
VVGWVLQGWWSQKLGGPVSGVCGCCRGACDDVVVGGGEGVCGARGDGLPFSLTHSLPHLRPSHTLSHSLIHSHRDEKITALAFLITVSPLSLSHFRY